MEYNDTVVIHLLDCINLYGLQCGAGQRGDKLTDKLLAYKFSDSTRPNHGLGRIELRRNPRNPSRFLVLQGHHRSYAAHIFDETIAAVIYDEGDYIPDPINRVNFERGLQFHETALFCGRGTVPSLLGETRFLEYVVRLRTIRESNQQISEIITTLEQFWARTH